MKGPSAHASCAPPVGRPPVSRPRRRVHLGRRRLDVRARSVQGTGPEQLRVGLRRTERIRQPQRRRDQRKRHQVRAGDAHGTGRPFQIQFQNKDAGVPHNVSLHTGGSTGPEIFKGQIFNGVETRTYDIAALDAGAYAFVCSVHPTMIGTLNVD